MVNKSDKKKRANFDDNVIYNYYHCPKCGYINITSEEVVNCPKCGSELDCYLHDEFMEVMLKL
ncbi:TPA: hypothetical protein GXZ54_00385 [bacterium]|nr:hypothetical protein [bacterium]